MTTPPQPALPDWLRTQLPPTLAKFTALARRYLGLKAPDRTGFLRTLAGLETEVSPEDGWDMPQKQDYKKLAETLLLFEDLLDSAAQTDDPPHAFRRAYQHYLINTEGPIPRNEGEDDFDVSDWASEYAAGLSMRIKTKPPQITIDDPHQPIDFQTWGRQIGKSSAWSLRQVGQMINYCRYGRLDVIPASLFRFEPQARAYSQVNALWLADLSQLVYRREGYVRAELGRYGFKSFSWIERPATDTQVFVAANVDCGIVGFRGTRGVQDILTDLQLWRIPFQAGERPAGNVHKGVVKALDSVWDLLLEAVKALGPERPIFVTGHSLGAALAQLAALRLAADAGVRVAAVYGFGSPCLGDEAFCATYDGALKTRTFLHVNNLDIVTTRWLGFHPTAQPAWRFNEGHLLSEDDHEPKALEAPADKKAEEAHRQKVEDALRASQAYLYVRNEDDFRMLTESADGGLTYAPESEFKTGRVNDHEIAQYLFKLACSIVDDWMAARS